MSANVDRGVGRRDSSGKGGWRDRQWYRITDSKDSNLIRVGVGGGEGGRETQRQVEIHREPERRGRGERPGEERRMEGRWRQEERRVGEEEGKRKERKGKEA